LANWGNFVSPTIFGLAQSAQIIIWVIVGGRGTLIGPILGCIGIQWLTTALGVLKRGFVVVGNLPTTDGTSSTVQQGSLLILNRTGAMVANLSDPAMLDGPWDLTIHDEGSRSQVFVSNVLNGTVTRLDLSISDTAVTVSSSTRIASGYAHRFDPAALVIGPTGLAYDTDHDVLYVASTGDNKIFAIDHARAASKDAGMGRVIYTDNTHLHGPLGLALAPNGHLITANGDAVNSGGEQNDLVEFTIGGQFVAQFQVDSGAAGGACTADERMGLAGGANDNDQKSEVRSHCKTSSDRGDAQAVTNPGVGSRAPALTQDAVLAGVPDNVLHGEKEGLVAQLSDQDQLPVDLDFKQTILAMPSESKRLATLIEYYEAILPKLGRMVHAKKKSSSNGHVM